VRQTASIAAACAALAALLLAGCSDQGSGGSATDGQPTTGNEAVTSQPKASTQPDPEADAAALATVKVTGPADKMPFFSVSQPISLTGEVAQVLDKGTGNPIQVGHAVAVHVASFDPQTDTITGSTYDEGPELLLAQEGAMPQALLEAMLFTKAGGRILFGAPVNGEAVLWSFQILDSAPIFQRAEGTAVTPEAGLPVITLAENGEPTMTPAKGDPPTKLVAQPLIEGDGDPVGPESWLVVHYRNWLWDGTEISSSWQTGRPDVVRLIDAIPGWQEGLAGHTIGSQVLLVVPPELAFGDQESERVPSGSTLVYVVDILAGM